MHKFIMKLRFVLSAICCVFSCQRSPKLPESDNDNGGLYLPDGFEALDVIDSISGGPVPERPERQPQRPRRPRDPNEPQRSRSNQGRPTRINPRGNDHGARHTAVNDNGDIYVKLRLSTADGGA